MHAELSTVDVAIIGGGPCGMGAAWRGTAIQATGAELTYTLIEGGTELGGSSLSVTTPEGFVFDYGGHILYPHANYPVFGELIDGLAAAWDESPPIRGVFYDGTLIPYPVQQNIHRLGSRKLASAFVGLGAAKVLNRVRPRRTSGSDRGLANHLRNRFGRGLSRLVMEPMNQKMWATPPASMGSAWTAHRSGSKVPNVADVSLAKVAASIVTRRDHLGWGPTTTVRYPRGGGTGSLWKSFAERLPSENIQTGVRVTSIDALKRHLYLSNGTIQPYRQLISTMPLDELARMVGIEQARDLCALKYASASFIGLGIVGPRPAWLHGVHSFHLPDPGIACWRLSFPASLSVSNVPHDGTWSILCEISHNDGIGYDLAKASAAIEASLRTFGIVPLGSTVISYWRETLKHGYPVPFLGRDGVLASLHKQLSRFGIYSRGRFGGWKYEVSNMDHTFMQGVEIMDYIISGKPEETYTAAEVLNA